MSETSEANTARDAWHAGARFPWAGVHYRTNQLG